MLPSDSLVSQPVVVDSIPQPVPGAARVSGAPPAREPEGATEGREAVRELVPEPEAAQAEAQDQQAQGQQGQQGQIDRQAALRALRNLEATEARLERNARREADEARGKLVQELLPVLDNLDRTIRAAHTGRDPAILEGVRLVRHQLEGVLRGYGVERVEAIGQRFDPGVHEAIGVTTVGDPSRHGVVVQQAEPGYRFAGRLLRPAKVSVGKLAAPVEAAHRSFWR
jgi:molecular chaperone GrpE (heat shock protein)